MNRFEADLVSEMRNAGIYALVIKGQGMAVCYERPLWRVCGDVDFFLSDDNYTKAKSFMLPKASSVEPEGINTKHLGMIIGSQSVELHGNLRGALSNRIDSVLDDLQREVFYNGYVRSRVYNNIQIFQPGINIDVIYVFTHILSHFYKGGIGLRQICDWSRLLWSYRDKIDKDYIESKLRKMRILTEWKAFGAYAVEYLGMPPSAIPFYSEEKWSQKVESIGSFILEVGNFGHNRDMSFYHTQPYLARKIRSLGRRLSDLMHHARLFPLDSLKFFPSIVFNGIRSAARGE